MHDQGTASAGASDGTVRLTGGRADPNGRWEYGRLEFQYQGFFRGLQDLEAFRNSGDQVLGRRGAQLACKQLGHSAGVEVVAGTQSALPGPAGVAGGIRSIVCPGEEESLADCIVDDDASQLDRVAMCGRDNCNAALLCSTPSGAASVPTPDSTHLGHPCMCRNCGFTDKHFRDQGRETVTPHCFGSALRDGSMGSSS